MKRILPIVIIFATAAFTSAMAGEPADVTPRQATAVGHPFSVSGYFNLPAVASVAVVLNMGRR